MPAPFRVVVAFAEGGRRMESATPTKGASSVSLKFALTLRPGAYGKMWTFVKSELWAREYFLPYSIFLSFEISQKLQRKPAKGIHWQERPGVDVVWAGPRPHICALFSDWESKVGAVVCSLATHAEAANGRERLWVSPLSVRISLSQKPIRLHDQSGTRRMPGVDWLRPVFPSQSQAREMDSS